MQGRHKKVGYKSKKTVWLPKSQWIVVENTHEPIIDRDTFETVQRMLAARTRNGVQGTIHPLAKKVVCGCCGSYMEQTAHQPRADGFQRRYVRCRMHQRAPERCSNKTCTDLNALETPYGSVSENTQRSMLTRKRWSCPRGMTRCGSGRRQSAAS